jgi:beta-phosphoglucomutase-like phosphatase (HAD superfamily)
MPDDRVAILLDIDGTLITTGGAGAASWKLAFDELYGIPADIGKYTDTGMTDPAVGRKTFESVMHREPSARSSPACLSAGCATCTRRSRSPLATACYRAWRSCFRS